jgi:signal transduction histidine kinase
VSAARRVDDPIRRDFEEDRGRPAMLRDVAALFDGRDRPVRDVLDRALRLVLRGAGDSDHTRLRIEFGGVVRIANGGPGASPPIRESFVTDSGETGRIELSRPEPPADAEVPWCAEEDRELVRSVADLLAACFDRRQTEARILGELGREVEEHRRTRKELERSASRRRERSKELTLAEERQRRAIARDLHDHLGQALAFLRMQLFDLQGDMVFSGCESRLETMGDLLDQAIAYTRTLTAEISPPVLYELGFLPAVKWLADRMKRKYGLPVRVESRGDPEVDEEAARLLLFLAVRELLFNVAKHAHAEEVKVVLAGEPNEIGVRVEDDGDGFDVGAASAGDGFGLFSVAERIRSLGGTVEIDSAPGRGTRISLFVPRCGHEDPAR